MFCMRKLYWCRCVSKFENKLHRTTPPEIGMETSSGGRKPEVTKDPWVTTGCPGAGAGVHYCVTTIGPRGRSVGNANGQDKWVEQVEARGVRKLHKG